jgi:hypothetical protein
LVFCFRCQRRLHRATPSIVSRRSGEGGIRTLEGGNYHLQQPQPQRACFQRTKDSQTGLGRTSLVHP